MGGICSRSSNASDRSFNVNPYMSMSNGTPDPDHKKPLQAPVSLHKMEKVNPQSDEVYDGIPRFTRALSRKSRSVRSTHAAVAKVTEVSSRLGRAGTLGLGKAAEVLDTLGSSMTNLHPSSGFIPGVGNKSNELTILAFEVANTIVKGSNLMHSLSNRSTRQLKEVVLPSEGVQNLVSKDMDELLSIFAADKREELKIFTGEVVRFGNLSKDPQWHNLERYFDKISRELIPLKQLKEEAELVMEQLMNLVHYTAELYNELQVLDRFELDYQRKHQEEENSVGSQKGETLAIWRAELKGQRKQVKVLKKKSLWSRSLEEVMEKLVDIAHFLLLEMYSAFGNTDDHLLKGFKGNHQRLGPAGLALHYANIVLQIDTLVARSSSMPPNSRDTLYQSLPPSIKSALRSKLQYFSVKEELTVTEIKDEMEKILQWLVPISTNTAKAHHGFGWVGEWANTGSEANQKSAAGPTDMIRIETLHHADKDRTEAYILDLVLWLHHLVNRAKNGVSGGGIKSPLKNPFTPIQMTNKQTNHPTPSSLSLTSEDQEMLQSVSKRKRIPGISKSQDFDNRSLKKYDRLSKSVGYSQQGGNKELVTIKRLPSHLPIIGFGVEKEKILDVIDRVDVLR